MPDAKNLHQRLLAVVADMPALGKVNKGHQYNYVSINDSVKAARPLLVKHGVLLYRSHHAVEPVKNAVGGIIGFAGTLTYVCCNVDNPTDMIILCVPAAGIGNKEQALGNLFSYALKYLLFDLLMIERPAENDPDYQANRAPAMSTSKPKPGPELGASACKADRKKLTDLAAKIYSGPGDKSKLAAVVAFAETPGTTAREAKAAIAKMETLL